MLKNSSIAGNFFKVTLTIIIYFLNTKKFKIEIATRKEITQATVVNHLAASAKMGLPLHLQILNINEKLVTNVAEIIMEQLDRSNKKNFLFEIIKLIFF